jgi:glycosyltransferase involved in cell wall biosynthesis
MLRTTLPALAGQETGKYRFEVIFVINGSSDESESVLKEASLRWPDRIRYFYILPTGGPSAPRNTGIRAAKGKVIVIVDDDVLPDPGFVFQHAEFHARHPEDHHAALGELYVPPDLLEAPLSFFHEFHYEKLHGLDRLSFLDFWTCNVSVKRSFMLEFGMFDESLLFFEDGLCGYQLAKHGMYLHFLPQARGQHLHRNTPFDVRAKGAFVGTWLHRFEQMVPESEVLVRYGVLSAKLPVAVLIRRLVNRAGLFALGNAVTMQLLKRAADRIGKRSRISDLYYYTLFRRAMLAGYRGARRRGI